MARGTVKFWKAEKGWGAISSADLPAGRGDAHFSEIVGDGFRELEQGDVVEFDVEEGQQDSFQFRALRTSARCDVHRDRPGSTWVRTRWRAYSRPRPPSAWRWSVYRPSLSTD